MPMISSLVTLAEILAACAAEASADKGELEASGFLSRRLVVPAANFKVKGMGIDEASLREMQA